MADQNDAVHYLAGEVSAALAAADLSAYAELLDPDVQWGPPGDPAPPCQSRDQVLSWYQAGRDNGVRGQVTETEVCGDKILVGLKVTHQYAGADLSESDRWQVLTVRNGRVAAIVGFDDRDEAAVWAGLAPAAAGAEPASWPLPIGRLGDDLVELRLPESADAQALFEHASLPDGMADSWAPLGEGATMASCEALIRDWLAGWEAKRSFHGPALVIVTQGSQLVGLVGLRDRGSEVVELSYGVAPRHRGRGYASHAARLAGQWLLAEGRAEVVELRIGEHNVASRRVAAAAGFVPAGTVTSCAAATNESYEDLRFVLRHGG